LTFRSQTITEPQTIPQSRSEGRRRVAKERFDSAIGCRWLGALPGLNAEEDRPSFVATAIIEIRVWARARACWLEPAAIRFANLRIFDLPQLYLPMKMFICDKSLIFTSSGPKLRYPVMLKPSIMAASSTGCSGK
jgi:hypothetical protein